MSLLSQIYATPSRVKGAVQLFAYLGDRRIRRSAAEALLSPPSLRSQKGSSGGMVASTLDECVGLGLIEVVTGEPPLEDGGDEVPDGSGGGDIEEAALLKRRTDQKKEPESAADPFLVLDPQLRGAFSTPESVALQLPAVVLDRVLDPERPENADLASALAWYLAQDVVGAPGTWIEFGNELSKRSLVDVFRFNDNRFQMLEYWAPYLGLANAYVVVARGASIDSRATSGDPMSDDERSLPGARLGPDPTHCLRRLLQDVLGTGDQRMRLPECMAAVAERCTLFEGAALRTSLEAYAPARPARHLSTTTSHALLRLEEEGIITLDLRSDADALVVVDGNATRAYSEISWTGMVRGAA